MSDLKWNLEQRLIANILAEENKEYGRCTI